MIWKWKRPAAFLLAAAMIFTMPGVPASAVEAGVSAVHTESLFLLYIQRKGW